MGQDVRLSVDSATQTATFQGPSGYQVEMAYLGNGQWEQPKGLDATLSKGGSGYNYTLRFNKTGQVFRFIGDAKLDRIENASGHRLVMGYDGERLTSVTDTRGEVTRMAYDSAGRLTTVTDPRGRTNSYAYSSGDLVSWTDAAGQTTRYSYDSAHRVTSVTDARGGVTRLAYDSTGRATSVTWANGGVTRYSYGSEGQVTMTDPNGNAWKYDFDGLGRMQSLDTPRGGSPITRSESPRVWWRL
ncbi:hypothetical protein BJF82_11405 [Kytococcus sp. CUA-901]|nr:hypothetical protein BJF82_11405 [Kytococcus sp. CUA-901]